MNLFTDTYELNSTCNPGGFDQGQYNTHMPEGSPSPNNHEPGLYLALGYTREDIMDTNTTINGEGWTRINGVYIIHDPSDIIQRGGYNTIQNQPYATNLANALEHSSFYHSTQAQPSWQHVSPNFQAGARIFFEDFMQDTGTNLSSPRILISARIRDALKNLS